MLSTNKLYSTVSGQALAPLIKIEDGYKSYIEDVGGQVLVVYYNDNGVCEDNPEYNIKELL